MGVHDCIYTKMSAKVSRGGQLPYLAQCLDH